MRLESSDAQIRFSVRKCMLINQEGFAKFIVDVEAARLSVKFGISLSRLF